MESCAHLLSAGARAKLSKIIDEKKKIIVNVLDWAPDGGDGSGRKTTMQHDYIYTFLVTEWNSNRWKTGKHFIKKKCLRPWNPNWMTLKDEHYKCIVEILTKF